jgi:AraC-like DNA-binding protein
MSTWSRLVFEEDGLGIPGVHSIGQYNYLAAQAGLPQHCHAGCVEISLLVKGHQTYQVSGHTYQIKGGEQYISLPDEPHDTGSAPQDKGILYWLILDVEKYAHNFLFLAPAMSRKLISDLMTIPSRHFVAEPDAHTTLDKVFHLLLQTRNPDQCTGIFEKHGPSKETLRKRNGKPLSHPREDFLLLEAASHLIYYALQTVASSHANVRQVSPIIQSSLDFIDTLDDQWLTVAQVADKVGLSESYFKVLFREEVGMPPAEYMLRRKVEAAKVALMRPECQITDLAYRLGFSSSQYFATVFRRFTNQTPSEFMSGQAAELTEIVS